MTPLNLPARAGRPRKVGITAINDMGVPVGELKHLLEDHAEFLDVAKLGIGSAYITKRLPEKIALYRQHQVVPYFGGTLFEKFFHQGKVAEYVKFLEHHKIEWIEISTGTIDIPLDERVKMVQDLKKSFTVVAEVGHKDRRISMAASIWVTEISALLEAGCSYVITEGRDSGTVGIYDSSGQVRREIIDDMLRAVDPTRLIFEAPNAGPRAFFINRIGPNVNFGNISPYDLLTVEAERRALRYDTFNLPLK